VGETLTPPDQNSDLQQALALHQAGNLQQAETAYRRILAIDANHPQAIHYLGVIALQVGKTEVAIALLERSVQLNAGAEAAGNLGVAYRRAGRFADAKHLLRQVVTAVPQFADAWANLAETLYAMSDLTNARVAANKAISINPNQITAMHQLASIAQQLGDSDQAIDTLERVIILQPNHVPALTQLGLLLRQRKSLERSIRLLKHAVQLAPDHAEAFGHLALSLAQKGDQSGAVAAGIRAVEIAPLIPNAHTALAEVYLLAGKLDDAEQCARRALAIDPRFVHGWGVLSLVLDKKDNIKGMVQSLESAVALAPDHRDAMSNLGRAYSRDRQDEKAISILQRVLTQHPNHAEAHGSLAFAYLASGDLKRGFEEYEWRWHCESFTTAPREFDRPLWQGSDPSGRTILVHAEQGYGDVIQFARYLPMLAALGARIIVECPLPLRDLIERISGVVKVLPNGLKLPDFDLHLPLMSLPRAFGSTLESIPNQVPYLHADPSKIVHFSERVAQLPRGLKVGLMWAGNRKPDPKRTCPLIELAPLADVGGVHFISLQKDSVAEDLVSVPHGLAFTDLAPELKNFSDTAALIGQLDLLLTIDTACAHLGGALGAKTWTLLPYMADWRWLRDRSDTPWYPTMRLFRQPRPDNWSSVILEVREVLMRIVNQ